MTPATLAAPGGPGVRGLLADIFSIVLLELQGLSWSGVLSLLSHCLPMLMSGSTLTRSFTCGGVTGDNLFMPSIATLASHLILGCVAVSSTLRYGGMLSLSLRCGLPAWVVTGIELVILVTVVRAAEE